MGERAFLRYPGLGDQMARETTPSSNMESSENHWNPNQPFCKPLTRVDWNPTSLSENLLKHLETIGNMHVGVPRALKIKSNGNAKNYPDYK